MEFPDSTPVDPVVGLVGELRGQPRQPDSVFFAVAQRLRSVRAVLRSGGWTGERTGWELRNRPPGAERCDLELRRPQRHGEKAVLARAVRAFQLQLVAQSG